jgi:hypothetical protein
MCFYISAGNKPLSLEYVSEAITLKTHSSDIIVDILVRNQSQEPITTLDVVYPNRLFEATVDRATNTTRVAMTAVVEDLSHELAEENWNSAPHNVLYRSMRFAAQAKSGGKLTLSGPDPADPATDHPYEGLLSRRRQVIELHPDILEDQWPILAACATTLLRCTLGEAIPSGEAMWLRWRIAPRQTSLNNAVGLRRIADWALLRTEFRFRVSGPLNVRHELLSRIRTYIRAAEDEKGVDGATGIPQITLALAQLLYERVNDQGADADRMLQQGSVDIEDWRLHIFPGKFGSLQNPVIDGDVMTCGGIYNEFRVPRGDGRHENRPLHERIKVYQWKSGSGHIPPERQRRNGLFEISFVGRPVNWFPRVLPWVLAAIVTLHVIWGLLR